MSDQTFRYNIWLIRLNDFSTHACSGRIFDLRYSEHFTYLTIHYSEHFTYLTIHYSGHFGCLHHLRCCCILPTRHPCGPQHQLAPRSSVRVLPNTSLHQLEQRNFVRGYRSMILPQKNCSQLRLSQQNSRPSQLYSKRSSSPTNCCMQPLRYSSCLSYPTYSGIVTSPGCVFHEVSWDFSLRKERQNIL